ncbi:hypothetical protein CHL76_09800 [Marinococcus halophilus]|uniref:DUF2507 domain-containing protein n=1 Tax=Marinococcus halophilus TaxID=1371 RepID=A0A510Y4I8_MARHA|nr:DUF2507 domain-containing protein [Marinococcus halophilus]OZT79986.1 hypothetical protein CHL76_09800 [Marinococcus halophilus]GEK58093.1 hypothetical protein MHA01_09980 [Marinococcus halophilus]
MKKVVMEMEEETNKSTAFGYELLRKNVLPDILGSDEHAILYWAGKQLARRYPCSSPAEVADFFRDAGWGEIEWKKERKKDAIAELSYYAKEAPYTKALEGGFLAEQWSQMKNTYAETYIEEKQKSITMHIKWE